MSQNTPPKPAQLPPALRPKPLSKRPKGEISDGFAPITPATRPVPVPVPATTPPPSAPSPTPAPVAPAPPSSAPAPTLKVRPKPSFKGRPAVAELDGREVVFEGVFRPEEHPPFVVTTKLTGNGIRDKQTLVNLARKKYPTGGMRLASTRIYTREVGAVTTFKSGATLGQLFGESGSDTEATVEIGHVFFDSSRCQVMLRNLRSRNCVTFSLRQPTGGSINFSNQVQSNRLARELPLIVKEILGNGARELTITLVEA